MPERTRSRIEFRPPWSDGTTDPVFTPVAFLGRLAVLVSRPRVNLVLYYGVLAPRAAWRAAVVPTLSPATTESLESETRPREGRSWPWADLMRRVFAVDVLACPGCNGRLRLIAVLDASVATARILQHLGLPTEVLRSAPARASPAPEWVDCLQLPDNRSVLIAVLGSVCTRWRSALDPMVCARRRRCASACLRQH